MNVTYDNSVDAKYISIKKGKVFKTEIIKDWLNIDKDKDGNILGIEILEASKNLVSIQVNDDNSVILNPIEVQITESREAPLIGNLEKIPAQILTVATVK